MKKLLSILLTVMMIASVFVVPASAFVPAREVISTPEQVLINQTWDGTSTDFTANDATIKGDKTLNDPGEGGYMNTLSGYNWLSCLGSTTALPNSNLVYDFEFDITLSQNYKTANTWIYRAIFTVAGRGSDGYAIQLPLYGMEAGVARSFKFTVDEATGSFSNVQVKDAGDESWYTMTNYGGYRDDTKESAPEYRPTTASHATIKNYVANNRIILGTAIQYTTSRTAPFSGTLGVTFDNIKMTQKASTVVSDCAVKEGLDITEDFAETATYTASELVTGYGEEANGNKYLTITPASTAAGNTISLVQFNNIDGMMKEKVITFDAKVVNDTAPLFVAYRPSNNTVGGAYAWAVGVKCPTNDWYSFRIEIDEATDASTTYYLSDGIKVYRKLRDAAADYTLLENMVAPAVTGIDHTASYDYVVNQGHGSSAIRLGLGFRLATTSNNATDITAQYCVDNFQMRDNIAYSGSYSKDAAKLTFDSNDTAKTAVLASYDGEVLKDVDFVDLTGKTVDIDLSVEEGTAASKLYVWNSLTGGKPILANPIEIQ